MSIRLPRGTQDILPEDAVVWQHIEKIAREVCQGYHFEEIRTPIFEHTEVFTRGVGDTTDIVQKEMYTFKDRGDRSLTLRPEGTASVVRSYVENKLYGEANALTKLFYTGPMFRYERPQAGRMRQFVQFGVEALGSANPHLDAEVLALLIEICNRLGLVNLKLVINSLGDKDSRDSHRQALIHHFEPSIEEFCSDCQSRLTKNPLRILDCKKDRDHPLMKTAPAILDFLNDESRHYFEQVKQTLDQLDIAYEVDATLVRGLDYYNHTAFELMSTAPGFGAITTLCGGGRYNGLVQEFGGPETPGIGFAFSIERFILAMKAEGVTLPERPKLDAYIVALGDEANQRGAVLLNELRKQGFRVDKDYMDKKMKAQFKAADRNGATCTIIIGEDELANEQAVIRHMGSGEQKTVAYEAIVTELGESIKGGLEA
ncbi:MULTISPECIES: histidine--tRNA ligase [Shouchella]|uniref:Histidine--tRNA ligase n=2 Tax=Bacillaceae TaxID=186817 RepID=A0A060M1N5_9BACI|nr:MULTISPECIES: histidine--tRNA ligase [Bacillaceae]AIC93974.1 histidyl-tRNA synthetase [Shouchella lehensis G1]KQL55908.1 histidyl-tRNA synthetase [Alkalicoccobacillus plakortidis]